MTNYELAMLVLACSKLLAAMILDACMILSERDIDERAGAIRRINDSARAINEYSKKLEGASRNA